MPHPPRPCPVPMVSQIPVLLFAHDYVLVEHIAIVARFSYCITGILIYSPLHKKILVYLLIILTNKS